MEDYKELIERLKEFNQSWEAYNNYGISCVLTSAIDAIEKLLKEREVAIEMLRGECHACKHNAGWHNIGKCQTCKHGILREAFQ